MKASRFLFLFSVFSFLLTLWVAFHMIQVGRHCLLSPIVKSVVFLGNREQVEQELPACTLGEYMRFWEPLVIDVDKKNILNRISFLSRAQQLNLKPISTKIAIKVSTDDPYIFLRSSGSILIGSELINVESFLERALLQEWLRSQSPLLGSDVFQLEVMSLLLWGYLKDQLVIKDPYTQESIDLSLNQNWTRWIVSPTDYCYSSWVALSHWEACQIKLSKLLPTPADLNIHHPVEKMGLAPYVASLIWNLYQAGTLKGKIDFWRNWKMSWSAQAVLSRSSVSDLTNPQNFKEVLQWIQKATWEYWASMGLQMTDVDLIDPALDLLVEGEKIPHWVQDDLTRFTKLNSQDIVVIKEGAKLFLDGLREVDLDLGEISVRYHIVSGCGKLSRRFLNQLNNEKAMAVNFCEEENPRYNWESLLAGGWELFMTQNLAMRFIFFHIPTLKKSPSWSESFGLNYEGISILSKHFGWERRKWDERLEVFRPLGVWDAVLCYRL